MNAFNDRRREHGGVLGTTLHVVLLLLVLGQLVYLASRNRTRFDLTSDRLWSSTESTRTLLGKLDKRLVIEAYFSPKEKLPVQVREMRAWADSFLDELVQLGKGKVVVQRFDPNSDKAIEDKAKRVGIKPIDLSNRSTTSMSVDRHWQGLRLVYGGGKQRVIETFAPQSSFVAEAVVVPAIKEVITEQKRKIGYMEWPATNPGGAQQGGIGWNMLRTIDGIAKRYEFQNFKDEDGALLPADLETLFVYRPKDLSDRQKYVLDQFVVKGGTLVAFCDAAEYVLGPQRVCTRVPLALDAAGAKTKLTDLLLHYGLDWKQKVVADMTPEAHAPRDPINVPVEYFAVLQQTAFGQRYVPIEYPYFFSACAADWAQLADALAKGDKALAEQYHKTFVPGMPSDDFLFAAWKKTKRGPGFYWPTWVGLRTKAGGVVDLPPDVQGRVLLWSSPQTLAEDPPANLNPVGFSPEPKARLEKYQEFVAKLNERLASEPRQQAPLMVEVKGKFTSFFASQERPKRPSEIKEEEAKKAEAAAKDKDADAAQGDKDRGDKDKKDGVTPVTPKPEGPQPADKSKPEIAPVVAEAAMVERGEKGGRILLIGDSDFVRDDFLNRSYVQAGGPYSGSTAAPFFAGLLDWLAEDKDLVALQSKTADDRTLKLVDTVANATDPRVQEQALRSKTTWLRFVNVVLPSALFGAFGLVVFFVRRAQKRTFLASQN
jgi:ABC-type uncharacterized transport system involved in gliding motility auxiliary subunit